MPDVYSQIKQLILGGEIKSGSPMIERTISEQLNVSRVPVREALKRLLCEGLLVTRDGKGLFTREYNEQEILDLYAYRESLDGLTTRLFTSRAEDMQIEYLQMLFREMDDLREHYDRGEWERHDAEFHHVIARGTRNDRIINAVRTIYEECFYLNNVFLYENGGFERTTSHLTEVFEEHRAILDAIASRDCDAAEAAARSSVRNAASRFMKMFAVARRAQ